MRIMKALFIFILIDFAWLFFRAPDLETAFLMIHKTFTNLNITILFSDWWFKYGMSKLEYLILLTVMGNVFVFDIWEEKNLSLWILIEKQKVLVRWFFYIIILVLIVMTFMISIGNNASSFLYQNF